VFKSPPRVLLVLSLLLSVSCSRSRETEIALLHFNDLHSQIDPFLTSDGTEAGGLARLAAAADSLRALAPSLLLCAGDAVQGTPYYNLFGGEVEVAALNLMRLDALALGNHEFDNGVPALEDMLTRAGFPVLCANLFVPDTVAAAALQEGARFFSASEHVVAVPEEGERGEGAPPHSLRLAFPYAVFETGGVRVGVIGAMTEDFDRVVIASVSRDVVVEEVAGAIRPWVEALRPRCDLVVVLSHCGVGADSLLAVRVPGIDVIAGGHEHRSLPDGLLVRNGNENGLGGTLVLAAGSRGEYLGRLLLTVRGRTIRSYREQLLPIRPGAAEDPEVAALAREYAERMGEELNRVLGEAPAGLTRGEHDRSDSPLGDFIAEAMRRSANADIALENRGGVRADLPPGPVTMALAYAVIPFENRIVRVTLTGEQVVAVLEQAIRKRGSLAGVTFRREGSRPVDIRVGGKPLSMDRTYVFATNDFCYEGGDGYTAIAAGRDPEVLDLLLRDAFAERVEAEGTIGP